MKPFKRDNLAPVLQGKKILLGVSGGIAAFKACDIVRFLKGAGAEVRVVLTEGGEKFVTQATMETLSSNPVMTSLWNTSGNGAQGTHHIETARWADLILIAPATANTIARLANGMADDLLTTETLAFRGPVCVAPAMNPMMFSHPATEKNLKRLRKYGYRLIGPAVGMTSCGEEGLGRMLEPEEIVEAASRAFYAEPNGKRAVVTLGPTRSHIDPVRYITNRSSGLMGASLCWALRQAGYDVVAVAGPTEAELPNDVEVIHVTTAAEMGEAALKQWERADVFFASAAVLDWDVRNPAGEKLKKEKGAPSIEFHRNTDILAQAAKTRKPGKFVLGFAAETESALQYGTDKLASKGCDAIFANDVSEPGQGFESESNAGWWIAGEETYQLEHASKAEIARRLVALMEGRLPPGARKISAPAALMKADGASHVRSH